MLSHADAHRKGPKGKAFRISIAHLGSHMVPRGVTWCDLDVNATSAVTDEFLDLRSFKLIEKIQQML